MNIGEEIGEIVATLRSQQDGPPYYMYGHREELNRRLIAKDNQTSEKDKKYPLIILILDVPEPGVGDVISYNLHLAFMTYKSGDRNAEQTLDNVILSILNPLYEDFLDALVDSGKFMWPGDPMRPEHTKIDRPKWGLPNDERNEAQYFADPVDAIEIVNLSINVVVCEDHEVNESVDYTAVTANDTIVTP